MAIPITSLVLLALLAKASEPTVGSADKAKAQSLLSEGSALYEKGDYTGALDCFKAAYATYPSPHLWFNIGQANRDSGRPIEALDALGKFLASAPDASPAIVAEARAAVADLQKNLGRLRLDCDTAGAELALDGKSLGLSPLGDSVWLTPGRHQVTATHEGFAPVLENVDITAGTIRTLEVRLAPAPKVAVEPKVSAQEQPQTPAMETSHGWWLGRKWTWVAAGSAVLLAGGAGIAGALMKSRYNELNKDCGSASPGRPGCSESDISGVGTRKTVANVLWGTAGAAALTAGVLFFIEGRPVAVAPMAGETTGLLARVGF